MKKYLQIKDDIVIYNQERKSSKNKEENKMIKDLGKTQGVELGSRLLTDGIRAI